LNLQKSEELQPAGVYAGDRVRSISEASRAFLHRPKQDSGIDTGRFVKDRRKLFASGPAQKFSGAGNKKLIYLILLYAFNFSSEISVAGKKKIYS
jgi:hypothetical protein